MKRLASLLLLPTALAMVAVACSDDESPAPGPDAAAGSSTGGANGSAEPAVCEVLGTLCHDADSGPGKVGECHDVGHAADEAACRSEFSSCISACVASEEGAAGAPSAPVDNPYCQALGELCHFVNDEGTPTADCHELGHVGNEPDCIKSFDACVPVCLTKRDAEPTGHTEGGGAGGVGDGAAGATSHAEGGSGGSP